MSSRPESVDAVLDMVRTQLGMDVAFVSEVHGDYRSFRALVSSVEVAAEVGVLQPYEGTYCKLISTGALDEVIPDTSANAWTRTAAVTTELGIGSYVGVPLRRSNGDLYGTVCTFSREAKPALRQDQAKVLHAAAELVMRLIESEDRESERLDSVVDAVEASMGSDTTIELAPVWELRTRKISSFEASPRFADEASFRRRRLEARDLGRGVELELFVLARTIDTIRGSRPQEPVSITLSPDAITDERFPGLVADVAPDQLVLTIDVHDRIDDYDALNEVVHPMRRLGLKVGVSHVGTGSAEMRHIIMLEPDVIRIDSSWSSDLSSDADHRAFLESLAALAEKIDAEAIAVGIESAEGLAWAEELGITHVQGAASVIAT
jgi:EAL domain-containing protein (putative c-di-GMP-specific phosphodiesterase class I)